MNSPSHRMLDKIPSATSPLPPGVARRQALRVRKQKGPQPRSGRRGEKTSRALLIEDRFKDKRKFWSLLRLGSLRLPFIPVRQGEVASREKIHFSRKGSAEARPGGRAGKDRPHVFCGRERGRTNERRLSRRESLSGDEAAVPQRKEFSCLRGRQGR